MTDGLPDTWWIGLATWVIQDGNYTDFVTGERRQFALELGYDRSRRLAPPTSDPVPRCRYSGRDIRYDVTGQLVRAATEPMSDAFVLDFGLRAYAQWIVLDDLEPPHEGDWLAGQIHLSVDHFAYMDDLAQRPGMPPLIHTWTIEEVQAETAPGSWRTVERTRAWDHDDLGYRLRCTLDDAAPTHFMAASGPRSPYGPLGQPGATESSGETGRRPPRDAH